MMIHGCANYGWYKNIIVHVRIMCVMCIDVWCQFVSIINFFFFFFFLFFWFSKIEDGKFKKRSKNKAWTLLSKNHKRLKNFERIRKQYKYRWFKNYKKKTKKKRSYEKLEDESTNEFMALSWKRLRSGNALSAICAAAYSLQYGQSLAGGITAGNLVLLLILDCWELGVVAPGR